jgi:hypothetical protein
VEVKAIPCAHLLLHAGACTEAVAWAGRRPFDARALADCPHSDWRAWLADKLGIQVAAAWEEWKAAAIRFLFGSGSGSGYGYGVGDGSGYGSGVADDLVIREPRP